MRAEREKQDAQLIEQTSCEELADRIADFVADHRRCTTDADCVIIGDCSHADFQSISRNAQAEGQRLMTENECFSFDGPTYNAVCRAGVCERIRSTGACGLAPQTDCPVGEEMVQQGCDDASVFFRSGCHTRCTVGDDQKCASGHTCQAVSTNPCVRSAPGEISCDACGHLEGLCLPAPACQLELALWFDGGRSVAELNETSPSTKLELTLTNRTDQPLTVRFDEPCHGPRVSGLGAYDVWNECLAGVCESDTHRVELTLAPKEMKRLRSAVVTRTPSDCNPSGLPRGTFAPTFTLGNVEGAVVCGPTPTTLTSRP